MVDFNDIIFVMNEQGLISVEILDLIDHTEYTFLYELLDSNTIEFKVNVYNLSETSNRVTLEIDTQNKFITRKVHTIEFFSNAYELVNNYCPNYFGEPHHFRNRILGNTILNNIDPLYIIKL
ncbi:hypothetical protein [Bacillus phage Sarmo]|nr:hypothetical protein [Bacillus phage Sarmo]